DEVERQQKVYSDVLGRQWKSEVMSWPDGNNNRTVYSTSVNVLDARDEVKLVNQYSGSAPYDASSTNENASCPTGTCQKTTMTYDGYGRLQTKHIPQQDAGKFTAYTYHSDDRVQSITDARGAAKNYVYNNRGLVSNITYTAPTGVPTSASV